MGRISIIVAATADGVIGANGGIPWHLSTDLRRFKQLTTGHCMVMGRRTFESLGRILPHRTHIVLSRDAHFQPKGIHVVRSWDEVHPLTQGDEEVFVIGGENIYRIALPHADRIYWTHVLCDAKGDAFFPMDQLRGWRVVSEELCRAGQNDDCDHWFRVLERSSLRP